jgi:hypothetical protein
MSLAFQVKSEEHTRMWMPVGSLPGLVNVEAKELVDTDRLHHHLLAPLERLTRGDKSHSSVDHDRPYGVIFVALPADGALAQLP